MDINLRLFSERLRRVLAGEEVTLPDAAKQPIQNLHAEIEIVTSWLGDFEFDMSWLLVQKIGDEIDCPDLGTVMEEINCFTYESEKVIDTFINSISQQKSQSGCSKDICDALQGLQSRIIDIKQRMQQVEHIDSEIIVELKSIEAQAGHFPASSSHKNRDTVGLDDRMEELLDLLIEGPPQLTVVTIVDSIGFDKTAFAADAYNSSYVEHYFDCQAWLPGLYSYDAGKMLDIIIKFLMPTSRLSEIMAENSEIKKNILREYLMTKRYLIVIDDVWKINVWDVIREIFPDNHNGNRVLITLTEIEIVTSFQFENGENIRLDLVPTGGPLRVTYQGWPFHILYHGSISLEENIGEVFKKPLALLLVTYCMLPFCLKLCFLYLSVFPAYLEISTRQLYQLWIAEGFIPDNNETTAEKYLEQLINRGFVEAKKSRAGGTIKACSTPGLCLIALLTMALGAEFIFSPSMDPGGKSQKSVKRFYVFKIRKDFAYLDDYDSHLHSLLYITSESDHLGPIDRVKICKQFKLLRVLDLGSLVLNQFPPEIETLFLLRYLKLNIPSLKSLPSSLLSNLLNLYTLDMPFSYIDHTADEFWKMNKLRHLNFGSIILPAHPGKYCSSLENLNFVSALHPCCCTEDILGRLPSLRNLRIWGDLSYYQQLLSKSLCRLSCLDSLKLVNESKMPSLSKIVLVEYQFPPSLTHLSFSNTNLMDDPMPALEMLPLLQVLKLKQNSYSGRKLACGSHGFPKLKVLHLKSALWLEEWTMGIGAMPKLECLIINPCAHLTKIPEQLWCVKSLNKFECWWPQPELRQKLREFEDKEHYGFQLYPYGI